MDLDRLHPQARAALGAQLRAPLSRENLAAVRQSMVDAVPLEVGAGPPLNTVTDVDADGVPGRLYSDADDRPVLLFAHGGGWVMGDLETHDALCRYLAAVTGWQVLAVDYRRAPEAAHPAGIDDVETALGWLRRNGIDTVAVGGDSAGAHLAVVVARRQRDHGRPLAAQVLICPALDPVMAYPLLDDYGLHREEMHFFWDAFLPAGIDRTHPDVNPFRASFGGLPPTIVITAEFDILRDEGERYASELQAAYVPVVAVRFQGVNHDFVRKLALFDAAHVAIAQIAGALHRMV